MDDVAIEQREAMWRLEAEDGDTLLRLARSAVEARVLDELESLEVGGFDLPDRLLRNRGAFVTLRSDGALRGCMGIIENARPLASTVCHAAIRSAIGDPRFDPVRAQDVANLRYEVSALGEGEAPETPFHRLRAVDEIVLGEDGLMVRGPGNRVGLLLPQVAIAQGWNERAFLAGVCRKAGLEADAWEQDNVELFRFQAQVFAEE